MSAARGEGDGGLVRASTTSRREGAVGPAVGEWYWVQGDKARRLSCVVHLGSNYAELKSPEGYSYRVHFNEFYDDCTLEPDAERVIAERIEAYRAEASRLMGAVRDITARLAVSQTGALAAHEETQAIALRSPGAGTMDDYKFALVKAQKEDLPALFKKIQEANEEMGRWMQAGLLPLKAQAEGMRGAIEAIEARVFNVELYAGLVECLEQVREGVPAVATERVRIMQRRHYMDEECLAKYEAGGMEFKDIGAFDAWLSRPENFDRLLPHPRCIVAFRVRRYTKDREFVSLADFIRFLFQGDADKSTFLYIRNGEQLWRLSTAIEFEEDLFPEEDRQTLAGQLWARMFGHSVQGIVSDAEYQGMVEGYRLALAKYEAKKAEREALPLEERRAWDEANWSVRLPDDPADDYEKWTPDSVYYDDIAAYVGAQVAKHNRLVLVLQGILDRSPALHPHPRWELWRAEGFEAGVELVHDRSRALTSGDKPDFEAYRARCNARLETGSVTVGQEIAWEEREAERENARRDRRPSRRPTWERDLLRYRPDGDPGPGKLARVVKWHPRSRACSYTWERERSWRSGSGPDVSCSITVPVDRLLCVDAYKPGDFRIFFDDPRTRAEYLKWAPLLLVAEDYHAGRRTVQDPQKEDR